MSQINFKKTPTTTFETPGSGYLGIGIDGNGRPVRINEAGALTYFLMEGTEEDEDVLTPNILANRGVGLEADLPDINETGDVYVTTDTLKVFTAIDTVTWNSTDLIIGQFVTDNSNSEEAVQGTKSVWQYDGDILFVIGELHKSYLLVNGTLEGTPGQIIIADVDYLNTCSLYIIEYVISRGDLRETGTIKIFNRNDTLISQIGEFDVSGFVFTKSYDSGKIILNYWDTLSNGNNGFLTFKMKMV